MRSNKPVNMDIDQLRGWASIMDKAMIASLVATILAVAALGTTTFLSFRYSGAIRAHEQAALDQYKGLESQAAQREQEASAAREQAATLERAIATERDRTAKLEREVSLARDQATALAQEAERARQRAMALEQTAREATERAAQAPAESKTAGESTRPPLFDAAEIRRRLADLGKLVKDATTRTPEPARESVAEKPPEATPQIAAEPAPPPSPFVESLQKFAGTQAAIFLLGQISDAPAIGVTLSADLSQAGWLPQTWTWGGVAGIFGVVVLIRDGSDPATHEAASTLVASLNSAGFNASKGDWPANWGRFRGTLNGPQTPSPTDAAIRIVIGEKARKAP
jgi:chemotaxis protein histidine kinase CheA